MQIGIHARGNEIHEIGADDEPYMTFPDSAHVEKVSARRGQCRAAAYRRKGKPQYVQLTAPQ